MCIPTVKSFVQPTLETEEKQTKKSFVPPTLETEEKQTKKSFVQASSLVLYFGHSFQSASFFGLSAKANYNQSHELIHLLGKLKMLIDPVIYQTHTNFFFQMTFFSASMLVNRRM